MVLLTLSKKLTLDYNNVHPNLFSNMKQIDKIRDNCINNVETQYAQRMEELVNELRLEDAEAILSEMTVDEEQQPHWFFMDDITDWKIDDLSNIIWEEIE